MMQPSPLLTFLSTCAVCLLLVGCGKQAAYIDSSAPAVTLGLLFKDRQPALPSTEALRNFPYAAQFVRIGDSPKVMMVLAYDRQGQLDWISHDRVILVTRYGRVVKLANWPTEIVGWRCNDMEDPLPTMHRLERANFAYEIDLMPGPLSRIPVQASLKQLGPEDVQVGDSAQASIHVVENITMDALGYQAINHYWLNPETGQVLKSIQAPAPGINPILIEVVRPYAP